MIDAKTTQSRSWLITRNYNEGELLDAREWIRSFFTRSKAVYMVGQLEKGTLEQRYHIQCYANFGAGKTKGGLLKVDKDPMTDYRPVFRDNGAGDYCMKDDGTRVDGPWEFGEKPMRRNNKDDWDQVKENALAGRFEDIPAQILITHYSSITKIYKDNLKTWQCSHLRGIYIWGVSGCGKSTLARELLPSKYGQPYIKTHNKWWDGYKGEKIVIWDDIDPEQAKWAGERLKDYCDRLGVTGETKGYSLPLVHEFFIMTSQYPPERTFAEPELLDAMQRRCYFFHDYVEPNLGFRSQIKMSDLKAKLWDTVKPDSEQKIVRDMELPEEPK